MMVVPGTNRLDLVCPGKADRTISFTTEHVQPPPGTQPGTGKPASR